MGNGNKDPTKNPRTRFLENAKRVIIPYEGGYHDFGTPYTFFSEKELPEYMWKNGEKHMLTAYTYTSANIDGNVVHWFGDIIIRDDEKLYYKAILDNEHKGGGRRKRKTNRKKNKNRRTKSRRERRS